ncbi:MAG: UDP-3-O-(3-hydroxymyristoyl)glucosamine N-acyltransferase [Saprospirales bacterium]|nr:UDP-3-O-(3-hydroxymyristoyl)glucosamine N-acyltransferase [Saprospirales bacterium]MBK8490570.1 UDP-3-O-(3-hydroxymyristoyl)glucosamine N-acyltransferase [Saprospirales bacterium]
MQFTAGQIAQFLGGIVEGDPDVHIDRPAKIEEGGEGAITFLANPMYEAYIYSTSASAILVSLDFVPEKPIGATLIRVENVYAAVASLLKEYGKQAPASQEEGISSLAFIHPEARIEEGVYVGPFSVIERGAYLQKGARILAHVFIGQEVVVGEGSLLYPGVVVYHQSKIGKRCVIHANAVIGSDGFGFAQENGVYQKIAQVGNVILEDDVDIGANTVVDRATMGSTILRRGVKIDNLVQVAHNVEIGADTAIAAQAGIAGSTKIGQHVQIGGQAGFVGHIRVADGVKVQAQSGVLGSIETEGEMVGGAPAMKYREFLKAYAVFRNLPKMEKRLQMLERWLRQTEEP